jgi:hypothetical protein
MEPKQLIEENIEKHTKDLFKRFLNIIEDLHSEHQRIFLKLKHSLPEEHEGLINMADYFDYEKLQSIRKKVLDMGNESVRKNNSEFEKIDLIFEFKK